MKSFQLHDGMQAEEGAAFAIFDGLKVHFESRAFIWGHPLSGISAGERRCYLLESIKRAAEESLKGSKFLPTQYRAVPNSANSGPFFTTKPTGTGHTGQGLSLVYELVMQLGGEMEWHATLGEYTERIMRRPL